MQFRITNLNKTSLKTEGNVKYSNMLEDGDSYVKAFRGAGKGSTELSRILTKKLKPIFDILDVDETPVMISGSSVLHLLLTHSKKTDNPSWDFKDYDLYFKSKEDRKKIIDHVKDNFTYNSLSETKNGEVLKVNDYQLDFTKYYTNHYDNSDDKKMQYFGQYFGGKILGKTDIIKHFAGTFLTFDIAACAVGVVRVGKKTNPSSCYLIFNKMFERSIKEWSLIEIRKPVDHRYEEYPKTIYRKWKYHKRGFKMNDRQLFNIAVGITKWRKWFNNINS